MLSVLTENTPWKKILTGCQNRVECVHCWNMHMQVAQFCSALPYLRTRHELPPASSGWLKDAVRTLREGYPNSADSLAELPVMVEILLLQAGRGLNRFFEPGTDLGAYEATFSDTARQQVPVITAAVRKSTEVSMTGTHECQMSASNVYYVVWGTAPGLISFSLFTKMTTRGCVASMVLWRLGSPNKICSNIATQ